MSRRKFSIFIILALFLTTGLSFAGSKISETFVASLPSDSHINAALTDHVPFSIDNDTHMESYASTDGWTGNGSLMDPFIIDFYNFSTSGNAIEINNVSYHFVISNCSFETPVAGDGVGVKITNSSNGLITECNFTQIESCIILEKISGFTVDWNNITAARIGILLQDSSDCVITNNDIVKGVTIYGDRIDHWRHQITNNDIEGRPLGYFYQYSGLIDGGMYSQIILADCDGAMVKYGMDEFISVHTRIQLGFCINIAIEDLLTYPHEIGLYAQSTNHTSLERFNTFSNLKYGVQLNDCNYWDFKQSWLCQTVDSGLYAENSHNITFRGCYLYNNNKAITLSYSNECIITGNDIYDNNIGLIIDNGGFHKITFNSIFSNTVAGLRIMENSSNCSIWANEFHSNGLDAEDGSGNIWDDGVFLGNSYANYSGPGEYNIPGTGGGIDHYPINYYNYTGPIQVILPPTFSYQEGTTGNKLEFYVLSETRYDFEIVEGGIGKGGGGNHDWPYQSFPMDGYSRGTYLIEVTAEDRLSNIVTETVTLDVTAPPVIDTTSPVIDSPSSIVMFEESNTKVTWTLYDLHPWQYSVYVNSSLNVEGSWDSDGETIEVSLQTWEPGVYNVSIIATDDYGNDAYAETLVIILPLIIIENPEDLVYIEGETGNVLNWSIITGEPDTYEIYRNGSLYSSGPVEDDFILCNVDSLSLGTYNFTLHLYEGSFMIVDAVYVYVVSETSTTTTTTDTTGIIIPLETLSIIITAGSSAIIAIIILVMYRSTRSSSKLASAIRSQ